MFAIIASFHRFKLDDVYVCAASVAPWHKETVMARGPEWTCDLRTNFKTEAAAQRVIERDYPL